MIGILELKSVAVNGKVSCIQKEETCTEDVNFELNKVRDDKQTVEFNSVHYLNGDITARFIIKPLGMLGETKTYKIEFISKKK